MIFRKIFYSLLFLTFHVLGTEFDESYSQDNDNRGLVGSAHTYNESVVSYVDKFPMKAMFKNKLPESLDFSTISVDNNIHLKCTIDRGIINDNIYLEVTGFYNLNLWANDNFNYDSWVVEKEVDVLLFLFDRKNKRWVGGDFDKTILSIVMICNLSNIYSSEVYTAWPKFKRHLTTESIFKLCLYNKDTNQCSTFSYSPGALKMLNKIFEQSTTAEN